MIGWIQQFVQQYFIESPGYSLPETIVYGLGLVGGAWLIYKLLKRLPVKIDRNFVIALIPFLIFGGLARALRDAEVLKSIWWITPGIWLLVPSIAAATLFGSLGLQKLFSVRWHWFFLAGGLAFCSWASCLIALHGIANWSAFALTSLLLIGWAAGFAPFLTVGLSLENYSILLGHMLDSSSAFVGVSFFGFSEQHILPGFLVGIGGAWTIFPLKISVVLSVLLAIDRYISQKEFKCWLKLIILLLGLSLGIRNLFSIALG